MVRKIATETNSFQAVLLPLQPARFPHQIDDSTCWQIGWATNCTKTNTQRGRHKSGIKNMSPFTHLWLTVASASSYLLLVVVDS